MKLFLLGLLVLCSSAITAGMLGEWIGPPAHELFGATTLLAVVTFLAALILGMWRVMRAGRTTMALADDADTPTADMRPVVIFIWWPTTIVAVVTPLLVLYLSTHSTFGAGTGLPVGIILAVGVFGFVALPSVVNASRAEFGARGLRGFWRAFRGTPWGDGMP